MNCHYAHDCGGCKYRDMSDADYRVLKQKKFAAILSGIKDNSFKLNPPIFIADGCRRRASLSFEYKKKQLILGFNQEATHQIINLESCSLLTPKLNEVLPFIRTLLEELCSEPYNLKKGKKIYLQTITKGACFISEAANGIDIVLEYDAPLELNHRMIIFEASQQNNLVIRISHRRSETSVAETIIEKNRPFIKAGQYDVFIPAGTFLQPSQAGQEALGSLVMKYLSGIKGQVADLFCGVGTFSYLLAAEPDIAITAIDSSAELLRGFQDSVNRNQITNIKISNKNLFKYPLDEKELSQFLAIVFDPPRAGAKALCQELAKSTNKPDIVVAVSCNPTTFVNDANALIAGGYQLKEITMVDQFIYSNHSELVACFTKV